MAVWPYSTSRWHRLRAAHLRAEPLCRMCNKQGATSSATVVDHIRPHKGDEGLAFDQLNLQSLCQSHHSAAKQAQERRGYSTETGLDGWPTDKLHPSNRR